MSESDFNLANAVDEVARVYAIDPELVLRRRFERLHHFNLFNKHRRLVELDRSVADLEILKHTIGKYEAQTSDATCEPTRALQLLKDIGDALEDFGISVHHEAHLFYKTRER